MTGNLFVPWVYFVGNRDEKVRAFANLEPVHLHHNQRPSTISRIDANLSSRQILCQSFEGCKPLSVYLLRPASTAEC